MGCTRNDHLFLLRRDLSLIDQRERDPLQKLWRTIFVLTMAVPQFVSLLIMRNLLNGSGPINSTLTELGMDLFFDPVSDRSFLCESQHYLCEHVDRDSSNDACNNRNLTKS